MPYGHIFDTVFKTIAQRRSNPDARYDCLAHWLKSHEENPARLTMKDIEGHTYQVIGAGSDTVSSCLQSFVYFIIRSPEGDHWQHIRDEIVSLVHLALLIHGPATCLLSNPRVTRPKHSTTGAAPTASSPSPTRSNCRTCRPASRRRCVCAARRPWGCRGRYPTGAAA